MSDGGEERGGNLYGALLKWPADAKEPDVWYKCQSCHQPHPLTRPYWVPTIIFALVLIVWRWEHYVYCPGCMRKHLAFYLIPNMLVATIACPVVLVTWCWTFYRTFSRRRFVPDVDYGG